MESIFKSSLTPFPLKSVTVGQHFMIQKNLILMITKDAPSNEKFPSDPSYNLDH